jgi:hypothetical protein
VPRPRRQRIGCWLLLILLAIASVIGWRELQRQMREHPERFPWTELSLNDPVGPFTGIKLSSLADDRNRCLGLLRSAGLAETSFPQPRVSEARCRFDDGVRIRSETARSINYAPGGLVTSCPVAAALALWERDVLQPAARRHFSSRVTRIDHAGSFSCRRLYGRAEGRFSEHATADAIDILGFRLADGHRVSVLGGWRGSAADAAFLREVRDGACDLFATVLSPDYNSAHADHFHLDQAERGAAGWRLCR